MIPSQSSARDCSDPDYCEQRSEELIIVTSDSIYICIAYKYPDVIEISQSLDSVHQSSKSIFSFVMSLRQTPPK